MKMLLEGGINLPVYTETVKDKKTGKMVEKLVGPSKQKQYYIRTYVKDEFGNTKQITRHNKNWLGKEGKKEAEREEIRLQSKIFYTKETEIDKDLDFRNLFYKKMEHDKLHNNNSKSTRMKYEEDLEMHVFPIIGDINIYKLDKEDLKKVIIHLKTYRIKKGAHKNNLLSNKYVNEIIHTTRAVIRYGIDFYKMNEDLLNHLSDIQNDKDVVCEVNPFELINKQTIISPSNWEKICNAMEIMINNAKEEKKEFVTRMMLFFTTEYILLTRVGETQALTYKNFLFEHKIYCLYEAYNKRLKKLTPPKNRKVRILYLPNSLMNAFKKMYEKDSQKENFNINQFVFGNDKVFPRTTIDRYRTNLLKIANVNYITNHELRHAGISNAMYNEVDASALADMAGHDKEIMLRIYTQTLQEANSGLINVLDQLAVPNF